MYLAEALVVSISDFVEKRHTLDVLHHEVNVLDVVIRFKILDDVWMVKFV